MHLDDILYGSFEVTEPVLQELIESPPLQRIKKVHQYGMPDEIYHLQGFTRYEHSAGVMLLLRKLRATVEEQAAGLLHDVSHPVFGHVIDFIPRFNTKEKENFQDSIHTRFIHNSTIPQILAKYGFDVERVVNYEHFSLLEQDAPALCADRIDYSLREFYYWADPDGSRLCTDNLRNHEGKIVFENKEAAERFGKSYMKCQREHWGGNQGVIRYTLLSEAMEIALENHLITMDDLFEDDFYMLEKLRKTKHPTINRKLTTLLRHEFQVDDEHPEIKKKKFRFIDPVYLENGIAKILSETTPSYKTFLEEQRTINEKGINVRLLDNSQPI